jgi:hypothetical protein
MGVLGEWIATAFLVAWLAIAEGGCSTQPSAVVQYESTTSDAAPAQVAAAVGHPISRPGAAHPPGANYWQSQGDLLLSPNYGATSVFDTNWSDHAWGVWANADRHSTTRSRDVACVTASQFGVSTTSSDNSGAFAQASSYSAANGVAVCFEPGTFRTENPANLVSGTHFVFSPGTVIQSSIAPRDGFSQSTFITQASSFFGGNVGRLSSNVAIGSQSLNVTMSSTPTVGYALSIANQAQGNEALIYTITAVSGSSSPYTVTTDRPIVYPFQSGDDAYEITQWPGNIVIDCNGGVFTGTGDRYIEMAGTQHVLIENCRFDGSTSAGAIGGGPAGGVCWGFDGAGYENVGTNNWCNAGGNYGTFGAALESNERSVIDHSVAINYYYSGFVVVNGYDESLTDDEAAYGTGPTSVCFEIGVDGDGSYGVFHPLIAGGVGHDCGADGGTGIAVSSCGPSSEPKLANIVVERNQYGVRTGGDGWIYADKVVTQASSYYGWYVLGGGPVKATNLQSTGDANTIYASDQVDIEGLVTTGNTATPVVLATPFASPSRITHFDFGNPASFPDIDSAATRLELDHGTMVTAGVQNVIVESGATVAVSDTIISGATVRGVYAVDGTGTLDVGHNVDFSGVISAGGDPFANFTTGAVSLAQSGASYIAPSTSSSVMAPWSAAVGNTLKATGSISVAQAIFLPIQTSSTPTGIPGVTYTLWNATGTAYSVSLLYAGELDGGCVCSGGNKCLCGSDPQGNFYNVTGP